MRSARRVIGGSRARNGTGFASGQLLRENGNPFQGTNELSIAFAESGGEVGDCGSEIGDCSAIGGGGSGTVSNSADCFLLRVRRSKFVSKKPQRHPVE
jgi:hypothetical protein